VVVAAVVRKVVSNVVPDRHWLLDRARAEQRQYHLTAAERYYRQALVLAPRDSEALSGLGELEVLRGTLDLAATRFQEALQVNADYIPALVAAADIRWESGHAREARQAYRNSVEQYSADSYPPYVAQRSVEAAFPLQCDH
jgi:tetratricopeptide (TPR) repeat protein